MSVCIVIQFLFYFIYVDTFVFNPCCEVFVNDINYKPNILLHRSRSTTYVKVNYLGQGPLGKLG